MKIIAVLLAITVIGYTIIYYRFDLANNVLWKEYGSSVYNLSIFLALIAFVIDRADKEEKDNSERIQKINQDQERGFADIEKIFASNYPESLPLYREMNQHNEAIQRLPIPSNIDETKRKLIEANISNIVLQTIENNFLTALNSRSDYINSYEFNEWVSTWRQWFKSPTLRRNWSYNKGVLFSPRTAKFIDDVIINQHPIRFDWGKNVK